MRFALIDGAKAQFPVHRLCRVLGVSQSGYFAWRDRPACRRQRDDTVLLAHVRSAFALSNSTYGSPRMTRELRDSGLTVGRRRIARLMRDNGLRARCFQALVSGQARSVAELARVEGVSDRYLSSLLPLAFLAPDIVEAIASGRQPADLTAHRLIIGCIATWLSPLCAKPWPCAVRQPG